MPPVTTTADNNSTTEVNNGTDIGDITDVNVDSIEEDKIEEYNLDSLMALGADDFPEFEDDVNHTGMKPLHEWMKHLPEEVRKHLANIRSSYTRKTQALAEERNAAQAQLQQEREALRAERASLYTGDMAKKVRELASDDQEHDVFDTEGMKKEIQRQAALMLQDMISPAQEQLEVEQRKIQLQNFVQEHPDVRSDELRLPIAKMLQERPELRLEDAYFIVKAKVDAEAAAAERATAEQARARQKQAFGKTSSGSANRPTGVPKFSSAWESFQWHKANQAKS